MGGHCRGRQGGPPWLGSKLRHCQGCICCAGGAAGPSPRLLPLPVPARRAHRRAALSFLAPNHRRSMYCCMPSVRHWRAALPLLTRRWKRWAPGCPPSLVHRPALAPASLLTASTGECLRLPPWHPPLGPALASHLKVSRKACLSSALASVLAPPPLPPAGRQPRGQARRPGGAGAAGGAGGQAGLGALGAPAAAQPAVHPPARLPALLTARRAACTRLAVTNQHFEASSTCTSSSLVT